MDKHCSSVSSVTRTVSPSTSPFSTAISSVDSALRASPLANPAIASTSSGAISTFSLPNPRSSLSARVSSDTRSAADSACKTNTLHRDKSAPFTSNDGFSVVAPIRIILPFSTNGRNASCCALLNLCISSTKSIVRSPNRRPFSASVMTCFISLIPLVTAEKSTNFDLVLPAIIRASVVLPTPGGPQNIIEPTVSFSISRRSILPSPSKCFCPQNSSSVRGLSRDASGCENSFSKKVGVSIISHRRPKAVYRKRRRPQARLARPLPLLQARPRQRRACEKAVRR